MGANYCYKCIFVYNICFVHLMEDNVTQPGKVCGIPYIFQQSCNYWAGSMVSRGGWIGSGEPQFVPHSSSSMAIIHGHGFSSFQNFPCFYQEEGRPHALALSGSIADDIMVKCEISALSVTKASRGSLCVQLKDGSCDYSFAPFHFIDPPFVTKIWPSWGY